MMAPIPGLWGAMAGLPAPPPWIRQYTKYMYVSIHLDETNMTVGKSALYQIAKKLLKNYRPGKRYI